MIRVQPADFDGEALVEIDGVARALAAGELSPAAARQRLARLRRREPLGSTTVLVAFAVVSASAAVLFGAGPAEALVAAGLGVLAAAIATVSTGPVRLGPLACALGVSVVAHALATWVPIVPERVTLAALIVLIPGLSLTMSLAELSEGHLVSGTARLGAVGMSFVQLGLGAGLGAGLLQVLPLSPPPVQSMPGWVEAVALAIAPLGIAVLMRVRWQDLAAVSVATWLGVLAARVGSDMGGPEAGAFVGALAVGLAANAYARRARVPSAVVMVPGILLLVPGSVGFRGFAFLLDQHTAQGVEAVVTAGLVAASLVGGLLVAHAVLPEAGSARLRDSSMEA